MFFEPGRTMTLAVAMTSASEVQRVRIPVSVHQGWQSVRLAA